ncbi:site-specific integrase [Microvirga lotononidis]|nr:site-specific integrase [Microvirga lotononidis]WQO27857.1 tyrosine-type recombinase/integrase [Microvirga lotononidis]
MDRAYLRLSSVGDPKIAMRNTLAFSIAEIAGSRRMETLNIRVDQIPEWDTIYNLLDEDKSFPVEIIGKGGHQEKIYLTHNILADLRDYIEGARASVIQRRSTGRKSLQDHGLVFISHTSGRPLSKDYFSRLASKAFHDEGIDATYHRIRARFLSRIVEECLDDAIEQTGFHYSPETVLNRAAELARHRSTASLKYYLRLAEKRRARQSSAQRVYELQEKELSARRSLMHAEQKLQEVEHARELLRALRSEDAVKIRDAKLNLDAKIAEILRNLPNGDAQLSL